MRNDHFTNTVEDAFAYEQLRSLDEYSECLDYMDGQEFDEDCDPCNCSDPSCPCGGMKLGGSF